MGDLACPGCKVPGDGGDKCPTCGLFLVVLDPRPPFIPRLETGEHIALVWKASVQGARGRQPASCVLAPVDRVASILKAYLQEPEGDETVQKLILPTLKALDQVRTFAQTRNVPELNQAWVDLGPAAVALRQASDAAHRPTNGVFQTDDTLDAFTDPNE